MAVFKVETKNKVDIDKKPRVYFTCHPEDFEKHFKKVCDDIFKTHDCAIYYTEDMTEVIAKEERETDLGRNNLFVIPVTFKLLTTPNRAMDEDFPYALKEHIPVLPIMMEPGIDEFYSKPNKFGELQYLNLYSTDLTEISYEEKLKKYLESVLISDELAKRIRAAFGAYIFLSYRKKDRKHANELMRLIHSIPECRDIAIWFDEFLTPGESFKENIEKILDDCKLFTLLVTPQLLEKVIDENGKERDNYVISTELPLARKKKQEKGTDIFAVEMEKTDKEALSTINIADYVNPSDENFRARLLETISHIAITANNTPEHKFLIGLAYLVGIDVEKNCERALSLITEAANENLPEAMFELLEYYSRSESLNYELSIYWVERVVDYCIQNYGEESEDVLQVKHILAVKYEESGKYKEALKMYKMLCEKSSVLLGESNELTLELLTGLANAYLRCDKINQALDTYKRVYNLLKNKLGETHQGTLVSLSGLAHAYSSVDCRTALSYQKQACKLWEDVFGEKYLITIIAMDNLADIYSKLGEYYEALKYRKKASALFKETLGPENLHTLLAMDNLAEAYKDYNNPKRALKIRNEIYPLFCRILGENHPETLKALSNLAGAYASVEEYNEALRLYKKAYEESCKIIGEKHSGTLMALNGIGYVLGKLNRHNEALKSRKKEYEQRCETLGETNKETLTSLNNVACSYGKLGNHSEALRLHKQVYKLRKQTLGENHIETKESAQNIINEQEACLIRQKIKNNKQ